MKRTVAVLTLLLALSIMALSHEKGKHVMGTVTSISDSSITVETTAKKSVTVEVNDKTKFEKSSAPATLKDLKVGNKVVIHAGVSGDKLVANEVHFGAKAKSMEGMKGMEGMDHK
jgi:cell division protein FtsL